MADRRTLQLINVRTGTVTTLGEKVQLDPTSYRRDVFVASDGVAVVVDRDQAQFFDTSGTLVDSFQVARYLNEIVRGGQAPTLEELRTYLTTRRTPWVAGTVEVSGRKCEDVTVSTTSGGSSHIVHDAKGLAIGSGEPCYPDVTEVRMSADGAAVYIVNGGHVQSDHVYFLDTEGDVIHEDMALTSADQLTWAFDDLVIAISKGQVTAFTPASA